MVISFHFLQLNEILVITEVCQQTRMPKCKDKCVLMQRNRCLLWGGTEGEAVISVSMPSLDYRQCSVEKIVHSYSHQMNWITKDGFNMYMSPWPRPHWQIIRWYTLICIQNIYPSIGLLWWVINFPCPAFSRHIIDGNTFGYHNLSRSDVNMCASMHKVVGLTVEKRENSTPFICWNYNCRTMGRL